MQAMSDTQTAPQLFEMFCHENSKCTVKAAGQDDVQEFETVAKAMRTVLERAGSNKLMLKVYSVLGVVIYETGL